jgi:imidazolonepropionase-like amidohydrolase
MRILRHVLLLASLALCASTIAVPAVAASLLIENVTLIDGTGAEPIVGASVLTDGERIVAIRRSDIDAPRGTKKIDGSGKYLIPGLMDMHIHLQGRRQVTPEGLVSTDEDRQSGITALHSYLYSGVTSVFDCGNEPDYIFGLRADERNGKIVAPRVFATGGIVTYPGSHGSFEGATLVDSWPEAKPLLDEHIARQPDVVKLTYEERGWGARPTIPRLPQELMEKIVEYYNDRGIRTTVHTSSETRAREAIFAGVDTLAHPIIQGPVSEAFAKLMGSKKTPMVTTLTIGDNYSRLAEHPEYLDQPLYKATFEADEIKRLQTEVQKEYADRSWTWWMKIMTPIAQENIRQVHAAGGRLVLGTDQTVGPAVHRELELIVAAGIEPLAALRIATLNAAEFLGRGTDLGSIEEGKLADMVLLDADPVADINNAKKINLVIKGGDVVNRAKLKLPANQ